MAILSKTDVITNDKVFRLRSKIESRLEYFDNAVSHVKNNRKHITKLYQVEKEYTQYINLLDRYILYTNTKDYQSVYDKVKQWSDRKTHLFELFGIKQSANYNNNKTLQYIYERLKESARLSSYKKISDRLLLELLEKKDDWYIVFSTLTVDDEHYEEVFKKGSNIWRNYIRKIDRLVAKYEYGSYRKAKGKDYFTYIGIVELGGQTGRLHIHTLMFMKNPVDMIDPNYGRAIPDYREIKSLCKFWSYGYSSHRAVRFSENDAYGRANWRWIVEEDGQPVQNSTVGKISGYILKYILKTKQENIKGDVKSWKVKTTKTLGTTKLKKIMTQMSMDQVQALVASRNYPRMVVIDGQKISQKLIRTLAVKEYMKRIENPEVLPTDIHLKMLNTSMIGKKHDHRSQSFGSIVVKLMNPEVIFNINDFNQAVIYIESKYKEIVSVTEVSGAALDSQV